ncbi:MAG: hypothetical protein M1829_004272 [Trizodia sp. TS-e1964]|nr:MAG: hypothetical protein M1829_004272 [Trizodia sp. TS-e1964]
MSTFPHDYSKVVKIGTRKSQLALIQTNLVIRALAEKWPEIQCNVISMTTIGDRNQTTPLPEFGSKNLWTQELEEMLLENKIDIVVHSLKDMPTKLPAGCSLGAILDREDPRDAMVVKKDLHYRSFADLPPGSIVGTSSLRRSAMLKARHPKLIFESVRGNVGTRIAKLDDKLGMFSCLVLAAAGLKRLGLEERIVQYLDYSNTGLLHAVGQGALGIEFRANDVNTAGLLRKLSHKPTNLACTVERTLLSTLEGGCSVPIGVENEWLDGTNMLNMRAMVVSLDGQESAFTEMQAQLRTLDDAEIFGKAIAKDLVDKGAAAILEKIAREKVTSEPAEASALEDARYSARISTEEASLGD